MIRFAHLRERYGAHALLAVAILLAIIVPPEARKAAWSWLLKGLSVMDVIVIVGGYRLMSKREHWTSNKNVLKLLQIVLGIEDKLDNGIKERLGRIERKMGIGE